LPGQPACNESYDQDDDETFIGDRHDTPEFDCAAPAQLFIVWTDSCGLPWNSVASAPQCCGPPASSLNVATVAVQHGPPVPRWWQVCKVGQPHSAPLAHAGIRSIGDRA
jgi:hypothetical protein